MNKAILTTIKKELKTILRDKRSLVMMLLTPLMIPAFIIFFSYLYNEMINNTETYKVGINYSLNSVEQSIIDELPLEIIYKNEDELSKSYKDKEISSYIIKDGDVYTLYENNMDSQSSTSSKLLKIYLDKYNEYLGKNYLINNNINIDNVYNNITYNVKEIEGDNELVKMVITLGFTYSIMAISLSCIYTSTDITAGEKERKTLETLFSFPISSRDLVIGKYLAVLISSVLTAIISLTLLIIALSISINTFDIYKNISLNISLVNILLSLLVMISYAVFVSALTFFIASFCKSYKEAQSALTPINFLTLIPMFLQILEIESNKILKLVPIINHTMLLENIFKLDNISYDFLLTLLSSIIYTIVLLKLISFEWKNEKMIFNS